MVAAHEVVALAREAYPRGPTRGLLHGARSWLRGLPVLLCAHLAADRGNYYELTRVRPWGPYAQLAGFGGIARALDSRFETIRSAVLQPLGGTPAEACGGYRGDDSLVEKLVRGISVHEYGTRHGAGAPEFSAPSLNGIHAMLERVLRDAAVIGAAAANLPRCSTGGTGATVIDITAVRLAASLDENEASSRICNG